MGECFEEEVEPHEYEATAKRKAVGLEKRSGLDMIEQQVLPKVVQKKRAINLLTVCDGLIKHLAALFNESSIDLGTQKASLEDLEKAMGFFRLLKKDVNDTIDICIGSNTDDSVWSNSYIKPFVNLVKSLVFDVGKLEAKSIEELQQKVKQANQKVGELLAQKM